MLPKDLLLPWRNVLDNAMLGLEIRKTPKPRACKIASRLIRTEGLSGFEHAKPAALSGDMRQRVAIMRTLAFDPEVILLDDRRGSGRASLRRPSCAVEAGWEFCLPRRSPPDSASLVHCRRNTGGTIFLIIAGERGHPKLIS
ncbi:ATP-binding cassette domain-containing protein [Bradyrhizobium sp. 141]|uniref:ATP-binding cassette domain-containing protein n=1 Tax=Bradyrhizobium sp. 141 TaxID=2782617 RepID=UPI001FFB8F30|nr:ATP-binding cassette domain-containing protein [Bradyrhizobium sp. 141]